MFRRSTQGGCIDVERRALLDIKFSLINLYDSKREDILSTWIEYGSGSDCCDWERVKCNTTTGHVTELSLCYLNGFSYEDGRYMDEKVWPLNVSLFLHFEELTSLDLSSNHLDGGIMKTELKRLSSLKMLEILDLSWNSDINSDILPSLSGLTSLISLDLGRTSMNGCFPANELSHLTNLKELDLSDSGVNGTPNIQACKSLSRLKRLESIALSENTLNKSIISCLSALPSLKILNLSYSSSLGGPFPVKEIHNLSDMKVLLFRGNGFSGTLQMEAFASSHHLEVLDLSHNKFVGSIPSTIHALSFLRVVSFAYNQLNGSLPDHGLCELNNLHEMDLSHNMLDGILPQCFNNLSSLKLLDISSNRFTGKLVPSLIANLTSLEYIDFSHNKFEGSFLLSSFFNLTKLEVVGFRSDNDKFEVETEEPIGWIPLFQLKVLQLSNCNVNRHKGRVVPGFLLHQHKLRVVDMSDNSLKGQFPDWLIKNNTNLNVLNLRNNSFGSMLLYRNANMQGLDISGNHMIGIIPEDIHKIFPDLYYLNLSRNALSGAIPSSVGDLRILGVLDLSHNELSGEVPKGFFTNLSQLRVLKLSNNKFHGQVLSGNLSLGNMERVHLDNNRFTGKFGLWSKEILLELLTVLDISNNLFEGMIPV
ncbi:unnamed protein product [Lactuca virosa]|uniref:Leucine-rich repeat-containing N-terminal plant-type domain-containing protein n=1 Tax=Lactuca virosa TaxID=75947 RepID=A0AAU9NXR5_9ASTR|nr:unnamed protein product [Lactuca virosa]